MGTSCAPSLQAMARVCQCFCLDFSCLKVNDFDNQRVLPSLDYFPFLPASTVIVVVPLLTIEGQLLAECGRYGIPAISGSQVNSR